MQYQNVLPPSCKYSYQSHTGGTISRRACGVRVAEEPVLTEVYVGLWEGTQYDSKD